MRTVILMKLVKCMMEWMEFENVIPYIAIYMLAWKWSIREEVIDSSKSTYYIHTHMQVFNHYAI